MTERVTTEFSRNFGALLLLTNPWLFGREEKVREDFSGLGNVDPKELLALARRHRVMPLLAKRMEAIGWKSLPQLFHSDDFRLGLQREARTTTVSELAVLGELRSLKAMFDAENIRFVVIKGLSLSERCFGQLGWRVNRDIDILIGPEDLSRAHAALVAAQYVRIEPEGQLDPEAMKRHIRRSKDWVYVLPARGLVLELHHRLFDNTVLCDPDIVKRAQTLRLLGQLDLPALAAEDELPYLALHGAMHAWSRLKWLIDVAILIRDRPVAETTAIMASSKGGAAYCALHQAVALCWRLFRPELAEPAQGRPWRTRLLTAAALTALARHGATELEATRFGTTLKNISHYLLWSNFSYLKAELGYDLTDISRETRRSHRFVPIWLYRSAAWIGRHR